MERSTRAALGPGANEETLLRGYLTYGSHVLGMPTEAQGGLSLGMRWYSVGGKEWWEHRAANLHPTLLVLNGSGLAV
jgi:hypothetical protein